MVIIAILIFGLRFYLYIKCAIPVSLESLWWFKLISAVKFLHQAELLHLDIKPDNVLLKRVALLFCLVLIMLLLKCLFF